MPIHVRPATPADGSNFLSLIQALADYEALPGPTDDAKERLLADAFAHQPPRFFVHLAFDEESAEPLGYTITFFTYSTFLAKPTLFLEDFFVLPEARTKGVGSALFDFQVREASRLGCGRMEWTCLDWNELAQGFYNKRGATHLKDWWIYRLTEEDFTRWS
ncbi:GNAT family N-acetyltransferase [Armatimonas rosea]|uniref:GNAT superfamily N-acetyltransferase n=1 Tax=Armatimonas rosea TaxID=685828 RepID=A0A7W9SVX0_ARMRO|nr:GNAT family N-acetyltransferase [Armatimonas rosea]MBB6053810.1 GNAT superfamily N-acetyltransferase [Armatimonas rosea]